MLSENPYVQIYTKRVLRRVPLDEDLEYIAGEIQRDIAAKVAAEQKVHPELTVQQIVKRLDDPAATARRYRQIYNLSTRAVQMFDLPLIYASVAALYMVTAFFVFRVFPQREYVAYAFCMAAAFFGAKIAYDQFFPLQQVILSAFVPPFLLLFYPIKNSYRAYLAGYDFWPQLFSQSHRVPFVLSALYLFLFLSLLSYRYIRLFHPVWPKKRTYGLTALFYGLMVGAAGLMAYGAVSLGNLYTREANEAFAQLVAEVSAYDFSPESSADSLIEAARATDKVTKTYINILLPASKQPSLSVESAVTALSLYTSGGPDALVAYYHTTYRPKASRPLPKAQMDVLVEDLRAALQKALQTKETGLPALVDMQRTLDAEMIRFRTGVRRIYEEWIYEEAFSKNDTLTEPAQTTP